MSEDSFADVAPPVTPTKSSILSADPETAAQQQLKKIYKILSQSFSREVASVSDVQAVIKAFVNKYLKTRDQLKQQTEANEQLNSQLQASFDQTQLDEADKEQLAANEEELTKKLRQYKKRVLALQDQLAESQAQTVNAQTDIRELQHKLEEAEREKQKLNEDLTAAHAAINKEAPPPSELDANRFEETIKLFEDMLEAQTKEIQDLVHQRDILIQNNNQLDSAIRDAETSIQKLQTEKAEVEKNTAELVQRNESLSDALPNLAQEVEQLIPHDLRSTLPQNGPDSGKFVKAVVSALLELRAQPHHEEEDNSEDTVSKEKYVHLLTRLEDAARFIQNIAKAGDKAADICPLGVDSEVRNCLLTQAARIGHFVNENMLEIGVENLPNNLSLFEPGSFDSTEAQLKEFLNFATEEQLKESPVRELFALFAKLLLLLWFALLRKRIIEFLGFRLLRRQSA